MQVPRSNRFGSQIMRPVKQAVYNSRTADKFVLRLPDDMREKIQEIARNHHRSMNSQMINWLTLCVELEDAGGGRAPNCRYVWARPDLLLGV